MNSQTTSRIHHSWVKAGVIGALCACLLAGTLWLHHAQQQQAVNLESITKGQPTATQLSASAAIMAGKLTAPLPAKPALSALLLQTASRFGLADISYQDLPADIVQLGEQTISRQRLVLNLPVSNDQKLFAFLSALKATAPFYTHVERLQLTRAADAPLAQAEIHLAFYGTPTTTGSPNE